MPAQKVAQKDKAKYVRKHIMIDSDVYRELALIAAFKYGTPVRTIWLVINEALKEYVERHRVR
jgi:hypothetical protein